MYFKVTSGKDYTVKLQVGNLGTGDIHLVYFATKNQCPGSPQNNKPSAEFAILAGTVDKAGGNVCTFGALVTLLKPTNTNLPVYLTVQQDGAKVSGFDDSGNALPDNTANLGSAQAPNDVGIGFFSVIF